jgi:hypothetical protein
MTGSTLDHTRTRVCLRALVVPQELFTSLIDKELAEILFLGKEKRQKHFLFL